MKLSSIYPSLTVVMPVYNEADYIAKSIGAVLAQDYPADRTEILVVDGMSSDGTRTIILGLQHEHPNLFLIDNPGKIVSTGLNIALNIAKGEIIVRIDGHTLIDRDYVRQCVNLLQTTNASNVGGKMNAVSQSEFGKVVTFATSSPFGVGGARFHYSDKEEWVDTVYLGAWPRHVFEQIGLFDEELVRDQDDEFNYRLRSHGGSILLNPIIRSQYTVRSTPGALWRQYFHYGFYKVRVMQKHPRQMSLRQFVPPIFVTTLLASLILSMTVSWGWLFLILFAFSYLLANLVASIWTASKKGWNHLVLLPVCFAILHFSYGSGFLAGLVKFWNRWGDKKGKVPDLRPTHA